MMKSLNYDPSHQYSSATNPNKSKTMSSLSSKAPIYNRLSSPLQPPIELNNSNTNINQGYRNFDTFNMNNNNYNSQPPTSSTANSFPASKLMRQTMPERFGNSGNNSYGSGDEGLDG